MASERNKFLDAGFSDESDNDDGYDSEAAEVAKGSRTTTRTRAVKRRKISPADEGAEDEAQFKSGVQHGEASADDEEGFVAEEDRPGDTTIQPPLQPHATSLATLPAPRVKTKEEPHLEKKPGVIYLSSLPPYLKPSALKNLLTQRGFAPITRLFLTPASKAKSGSKRNSRQLYTEGWIEFASKKTARRCAETLNAQPVGGKKGGFYHDDVWNMKYLRGMRWSELMAGVREERREEEGRRDEERRLIARETKTFIEGVDQAKKVEGMRKKRKGKLQDSTGGEDVGVGEIQRTWRQFEVKRRPEDGGTEGGGPTAGTHQEIGEDVKRVLGKIF